MDSLRSYFLQIVASCMICAIAAVMVKTPSIQKIVRLLGGLLILLVVLSPLMDLDLQGAASSLTRAFGDDSAEMEQAQADAAEHFATQVRKATEDHIELIASRMGYTVQAQVTVSQEEVPVPTAVEISGSLSAEEILALSEYLELQLGIAKEDQTWRPYETVD